MPVKPFSGLIAGYDPGGNGKHGLALAEFQAGVCKDLSVVTLPHTGAVVSALDKAGPVAAIGIDTLACWGTGESGWRAADLWLRRKYKPVQQSIVSPNGLYGSMGLNGMAVLCLLRKSNPNIEVTETHPKVLYWALAKKKYSYSSSANVMDSHLADWLNLPVTTGNDHEWDAVASVLAAIKGITGKWYHDLFMESVQGAGRLVFPAGTAHYWWPE